MIWYVVKPVMSKLCSPGGSGDGGCQRIAVAEHGQALSVVVQDERDGVAAVGDAGGVRNGPGRRGREYDAQHKRQGWSDEMFDQFVCFHRYW